MSLLTTSPVVQRIVIKTQVELNSPTPAMLADYSAVYQLNVAPFTRWTSNGTELVSATGLSLADIAIVVDARTQLGAMAPAVQAIADAGDINTLTAARNDARVLIANPANIGGGTADGQDFPNLLAMVLYAIAKPGGSVSPTAPVLSAVPTVDDSTADEGQTITISKATWTGTQPITWFYEILMGVNNQIVLTTSNTSAATTAFAMPVVPAGVARTFKVRQQIIEWPGVTATSAQGTVNAVAAPKPQNSTLPAVTGTIAGDSSVTFDMGAWTNTPTSYSWSTVTTGGTTIESSTSGSRTFSHTLTSSLYAGLQFTLQTRATNANGISDLPASVSAIYSVSGAVSAPSYVGRAGPSWAAGTIFQVGQTGLFDFGDPSGNVIGFDVNVYRNGPPSIQTFTNITSGGYLYLPADADQDLSFDVVAKNLQGASGIVQAASQVIAASTGGGGGTGSFVGTTQGAANPSATNFTIPVISSIQSGDLLRIGQSNNGPEPFNAPTGGAAFSQIGSTLSMSQEEAEVYGRTAGAESSDYTVSLVTGPNFMGGIAWAWRGPTATDFANQAITTSGAAQATITLPAGATTIPNESVSIFVSLDCSVGGVHATFDNLPSGFTVQAQQDFLNGAGTGACIALITGTVAASGTNLNTLSYRFTVDNGTADVGTFVEAVK